MSRPICLLCLVAGAVLAVGLTGCSQSSASLDPELLASHRARLTMVEEPEGAQVVPEVRNALLGISDEHEDHDHAGHDHGDGDHDEHAHDEQHEHEEADHDEADHAAHDHEDEHEHDEGEHDHAGHDHEDHDHETVQVVKTTASMEVVLVGQIGGLTNPWEEAQPDFPFARNQAAFFLADPQAVVENEESGHSHAPGEECAFCLAHADDLSAMLAMVRFLDKDGRVLRTDVRQLFDVKEQDTVVVRGSARVLVGGMMVVDATGFYVRR